MRFAQHLQDICQNTFAFAQSIREKVLPTPGRKREREEDEGSDHPAARKLRLDNKPLETFPKANRHRTARRPTAQPPSHQPQPQPQQNRTPELQTAYTRELTRKALPFGRFGAISTPYQSVEPGLFSPTSRPSYFVQQQSYQAQGAWPQRLSFLQASMASPGQDGPLRTPQAQRNRLDMQDRQQYKNLLQQHNVLPASQGAMTPTSTPVPSHPSNEHTPPLGNEVGLAPPPQDDAQPGNALAIAGRLTPSLQELQANSSVLAALSIQADEEGLLARKAKFADAKARLKDHAVQRTELLARADRVLDSLKPQARATVEVGVQHDASSKVQGDTTRKILEENQTRLQNLRPPAERKPAPAQAALKTPQPPAKLKQQQVVLDLLSDDEDEEEEEAGAEASSAVQGESSEQEESDISDALRDTSIASQHEYEDWDEEEQGPRPLSHSQAAAAQRALADGNPAQVICRHDNTNIEMTRGLLACLMPLTWLNDEVMNIYIGLLQDRDTKRRSQGLGPKCHFTSSFFVNRLYKDASAYSYSNVRRWTLPNKLKACGQQSTCVLDCDRVIVPVHLSVHWTCAVIDLEHKELSYYDSMGAQERKVMAALRQWVSDEWRDKRDKEVDTSTWPIRYPADIPQQYNGCDCGVFALEFADYAARDAP